MLVPRHIAIIMDGNGRWAQARGMPRIEGHRAGAKTVDTIVTYCRELGVQALTLYAFSSENWARPVDEVSGLMGLLTDYLTRERRKMLDNGIRLGAIGNTGKLPLAVRVLHEAVKRDTAKGDGMRLTLALSYGSREEIVRGVRSIAEGVAKGELSPKAIDEAMISESLDTAELGDVADPDLIIRTSGEQRLSNFLMWQAAYSEFYFAQEAWPDFDRASLNRALLAYASRRRRFGMTDAQLAELDAASLRQSGTLAESV